MTELIFNSVIFSNLSPLKTEILGYHNLWFVEPVFAYIGPGMGGGVIAAIFGIIAAFFLGLWGILYYPIKRAFKNKKKKNTLSRNKNNSKNRK